MNEKQQIFEIIDGFKNLTSKIKKDNDDIKNSMKNKDVTIAACKKEYKKLYAEHEELKQKYAGLEKYFYQIKQQKQQQQQQKIRKRQYPQPQLKQKQKRFIIEDDNDNDENDDNYNEELIIIMTIMIVMMMTMMMNFKL